MSFVFYWIIRWYTSSFKKNTTADILFAKHNYSPSRTYELRYNHYKTKPIWREIKIHYCSEKFSLFFWIYIQQLLLLICCSNWDTWVFWRQFWACFSEIIWKLYNAVLEIHIKLSKLGEEEHVFWGLKEEQWAE